MKRPMIVRIVVGIVVLVFVVGTWITSGTIELGWLKYFSAAVFVATIALALWDIWIWRWPTIQRIPGVTRCLQGTWKGMLTSFWIDPATGKRPQPKAVYLVVRQTATLISTKLVTDESRSKSSLADISTSDGSSELTYLYIDRPDARVEDHSRMHHGSTVLDISGTPARRLKGRYWTDRDSKGELDFGDRAKKLADDFEEAESLFVGES